MNIKNTTAATYLTAFGLAALTLNLSGSVIVQDGFNIGPDDYTTDTLMSAANGQPGVGSGPVGTSGVWTLTQGLVASSVNLKTSSDGLTFGSWATGSGSVISFRNGSSINGQYDMITYQSPVTASNNVIEGTESVYFSALVNYNAGYGAGVGIEFDSRNEGTERGGFGVGVDGNGEAIIWSEDASSGLTLSDGFIIATTSGLSLNPNTTYLIVGKMTGNTLNSTDPETIDILGVYDSAAAVPTLEPSSILSTTYDVYFTSLPEGKTLESVHIWGGKSASGIVSSIDEIRVSSDFATAVPEPSQYALLVGLGILGFVAYRKRR